MASERQTRTDRALQAMIESLDFLKCDKFRLKKENFRLTVKEERFLVRHLKVERPGFLQARVKDRSIWGADKRSERIEPAWSRVKDAQKWNCRIVSKVDSNSGGRDFWGESSIPTTSGWQLRRTLSGRGYSRQHTDSRCELWDPMHVHEFWLNPEHASLGREGPKPSTSQANA